jgi:hypothetical protein
MADAKRDQLKFILPKGIAIYPKLIKPDTKFDPAGKFEVKLQFDAETIAPVLEKLVELRDRFAEDKKAAFLAAKKPQLAKSLKLRDVGTPDYDKEGDENGMILLKPSSKASGVRADGSRWERTIPLFDAKGKKIEGKPAIYGGSELKVAVIAEAYHKADGNEIGVSLRIDAVQVIKLVSAGGKDADSFGFGEEEGYEGSEESAGGFGDESGGDAPASAGGDPDGNVDF